MNRPLDLSPQTTTEVLETPAVLPETHGSPLLNEQTPTLPEKSSAVANFQALTAENVPLQPPSS